MRKCKGFTLPETTLAFLVFMVIAGAVASVIIIGMNISVRSARNTNAQLAADGMYDYLCERLCYGRDISIGFSSDDYPQPDNARMIYLPRDGSAMIFCEGTDTIDGEDVFGKDILRGMKLYVRFSYNNRNADIIGITLELKAENEVYSRSGAVKLMNNIGYCDIVSGVCTNEIGDVYIIYRDV